MTALLVELRLAIRTLRKTPAFTVTALVTLALGMTLCMTVMAVANAYLLNDLPYPAADRLYWIRYGAPGQEQPRQLETLDWTSLDDVVEHGMAWDLDMFYLLGGEHAESAPGAWVTRGFMQGLGIQPAIGRGFDESAFAPGAANVALISHRLWTSRFGGDPAIVGRTFSAYVSDRPEEAESFTIVGVLPQRFWHINPYTDILTPLRAPTYPYMARLRTGVTAAAAASRIAALVRAGATNVPPNWTPTIVAAHEAHVMQIRPTLRAVSAAAALVLLVACANVAGLLLVRATRRSREIAVRVALGAGHRAIARMLFAEGIVLAGGATVAALGITALTIRSLAPVVQQQLGRSVPGGTAALIVDGRVIAFAAVVGALTSIICTLAPLLTALRPRAAAVLHGGTRTATEGRSSRRIRSALIAIEVAVSLTLLASSGLMLRSVVKLLQADLGFSSERVVTASLTLRQHRYPDAPSRASVFERIAERVGTIGGVESVGLTTASPVQQPRTLRLESAGAAPVVAQGAVHGINDRYFETLGIPLLRGRAFAATDRLGSEPVALVSESLARQLWPAGNAIGSRILVPQAQDRGEPTPVSRTVVGIVQNIRQDPSDVDLADVYVPMLQAPTRFTFVFARTADAPGSTIASLRTTLRQVDAEFALDRARPLQLLVDDITARPRFLAWLLACFAAVAALLALVGVYGVIAYAVRQREREIAVRLAIGADPARITRLFVRDGAAIVLAGIAIGVPAALAGGRLMESQLFGVTPRDPIAVAGAAAAFAAAGFAAIWWPARRAAATDPAIALRAE